MEPKFNHVNGQKMTKEVRQGIQALLKKKNSSLKVGR